MSKTLRLEAERLILRTSKDEDAYLVSYNSRRPRVAAEMSDMILVDEAVGSLLFELQLYEMSVLSDIIDTSS